MGCSFYRFILLFLLLFLPFDSRQRPTCVSTSITINYLPKTIYSSGRCHGIRWSHTSQDVRIPLDTAWRRLWVPHGIYHPMGYPTEKGMGCPTRSHMRRPIGYPMQTSPLGETYSVSNGITYWGVIIYVACYAACPMGCRKSYGLSH